MFENEEILDTAFHLMYNYYYDRTKKRKTIICTNGMSAVFQLGKKRITGRLYAKISDVDIEVAKKTYDI